MTIGVARDVSDTARWVAHFRALESERDQPLFRDPYARRLAGERGRTVAEQMVKEPLAWSIAIRTRVFDELISLALREHAVHTVLNLAAGLDTRPQRLSVPSGVRWIEVDQPGIIQPKGALLANEPATCQLERIALDLRNVDARRELFARVNRESSRVLVVSEGFLIYLDAQEVGSLADDLHTFFPSALWLLDVVSPDILAQLQASLAKTLEAAHAEMKFAPADGLAFFERHGFAPLIERSLLREAARLGREMKPVSVLRWLLNVAPTLAQRFSENPPLERNAVLYALMRQRRR
ncbi:MAG: class I SAM-dependent methyltransferase [Myxococcota bacterium]